jgi:hypothetical protein
MSQAVSGFETADVYHPSWVQIVSWLGLPLLTVAAAWLATRFLWEPELTLNAMLASTALGVSCLYQCVIGWRAMPHVGTRMKALPEGLQILSGRNPRLIPWTEFESPKDYPFATATRLVLRNGEDVMFVFDNMKGLGAVRMYIAMHRDQRHV